MPEKSGLYIDVIGNKSNKSEKKVRCRYFSNDTGRLVSGYRHGT